MSQLGVRGNSFVRRRFQEYLGKHPQGQLKADPSLRRVLVTGFGLFENVPYNMSSVITRALLANSPSGLVVPNVAGASAASGTIEINSIPVQVGILTLEVVWDLAPAIVLHEMSAFDPDVVILTGRGGEQAIVEGGAINDTEFMPGYDFTGQVLKGIEDENRPYSNRICEDLATGYSIPMTWDSEAAFHAISAQVTELGVECLHSSHARRENRFVCNNLSFGVLRGIQKGEITLAGGEIKIHNLNFQKIPKVGFFHFPNWDRRQPEISEFSGSLLAWREILKQIIKSQIQTTE